MEKFRLNLPRLRKLDEARSSLLLLLLLSADYAFIILHIINRINPFEEPRLFRLDIDGSHSEFYQYIKFFWIIVLLISVLIATRSKGYLSWILVFSYFLLDDALQIHEDWGLVFGNLVAIDPPLGLRERDVGEVVVFALFGIVLMAGVAWAYFRSSKTFRNVSKDLLIFTAVFVFFVVFVDVIHAAFSFGSIMNTVVVILEDGGEMLIVSLMLWYSYVLALKEGEPELFVHEALIKPRAVVE